MEEEIYNNEITIDEEIYNNETNSEIMNNEITDEELDNNITMEGEKTEEITEKKVEDSKNIYKKKMEIRKFFHKTPIKKDDYKLEYDNETPQEERRRTLLQYQKKSREEAVNAARGIILEKFFPENDFQRRFTPRTRIQVMLSEWMLDVPENFIEEWLMVPCPIGRRTILVASQGRTRAYNRKGYLLNTFLSALPGGSHRTSKNSQYTILDCIWERSQKTFYVLDILAWSSHPIMYCEAECRRFLVRSHLSEIETLEKGDSQGNKYPILPLPDVKCDTDLSEALMQFGNQYSLDGLLFFHKKGHYKFGHSPLCVWLKPFMLSEVLGIFVPSPHHEKPDSYIDYRQYICDLTRNPRQKQFLHNYFGIPMDYLPEC